MIICFIIHGIRFTESASGDIKINIPSTASLYYCQVFTEHSVAYVRSSKLSVPSIWHYDYVQ